MYAIYAVAYIQLVGSRFTCFTVTILTKYEKLILIMMSRSDDEGRTKWIKGGVKKKESDTWYT